MTMLFRRPYIFEELQSKLEIYYVATYTDTGKDLSVKLDYACSFRSVQGGTPCVSYGLSMHLHKYYQQTGHTMT